MKHVVKDKSFAFAKDIIYCTKYLNDHKQFVLARQLLRSGTAVGALIREAEMGESAKDFTHKMYIALKEANETSYWLELLTETNVIPPEIANPLASQCTELIRLLMAITKTMKKKLSS